MQFLDKKRTLDDIKIDVNYFKTDVRTKIRKVRYDLLKKHFSSLKVVYISFVESMYEFFYTRSNNYRMQDPLFLLGILIQKNSSLI